MKRIINYTKYLVLPLFIFLIGCSFENQVLVSIDGNAYTIADFKDYYQFAPTEDSVQRLAKIDEFINRMCVVKEAEGRGYEDDPVVQAAFETHQKEIIYRAYYEANVIDKIKISDAELEDAYNDVVDQYHLAQIVIAEESLAFYLEKELKRGVPFDSLLKFSLDTLTENGDIGSFSVMSLPPEILGNIKDKKAGEVTDAIKFGDYYYILKVIEHKKSDTPKFEEVKENIKNNIMRNKVMEMSEKFVQDVLDKAEVEYNQEGLDALIKPDSLITQADLNKWVVKKYDTAYVYVKTIRNAVLNQYRQSFIDPQRLIERVLIPDLIYDAAIQERFDKKVEIKRRLRNSMASLVYRKFYSDEVLDKVTVDSAEVENYYKAHKDEYKDKELKDVFHLLKTEVRSAKIESLRNDLYNNLRAKYKPNVKKIVLTKLLKEEK
jgi:hypothetical protein